MIKGTGAHPLDPTPLDCGGIPVAEMDPEALFRVTWHWEGGGYRMVIYLNQGQLFLVKCSEWQILGKFFRTVNMLAGSH